MGLLTRIRSFRYCQQVQHPLEHIEGRTADGIFYLRPEIALLYNASSFMKR
jgi:hypothetical protein